jgi:hypothetical protein
MRGLFVMLVFNVADDLLDQILDRDQAVGAAIFVDHQREVNARRLHLGEEIERRHRRRHEQDGADDLRLGQRHAEIDRAQIEIGGKRLLAFDLALRGDGRLRRHVSDQIADVHKADGIVERIVINDETRVPGLLENFHQFAERDVLVHRDDVGARDHDVFDAMLAQPEDVPEHRPLFRREAGVGKRVVFQQHRDIGAG